MHKLGSICATKQYSICISSVFMYIAWLWARAQRCDEMESRLGSTLWSLLSAASNHTSATARLKMHPRTRKEGNSAIPMYISQAKYHMSLGHSPWAAP